MYGMHHDDLGVTAGHCMRHHCRTADGECHRCDEDDAIEAADLRERIGEPASGCLIASTIIDDEWTGDPAELAATCRTVAAALLAVAERCDREVA